MVKTVLVVAAHSDDEALGCAGTMAKHVAEGDKVHVLFMTDGVGSRQMGGDDALERQISASKAMEILSVATIQSLNFPDNKMDSVPLLDVTQAVEKTISDLKPEVIYTHHVGDLNIDHQVTHRAVITACRPQPGFCVKEIYAFEIPSSTEWQTPGLIPFIPNIFVDITDFIEIKRKLLVAYRKEMRQPPHSRSEENSIKCSEVRGNSVGINYAEAFSLVRLVR